MGGTATQDRPVTGRAYRLVLSMFGDADGAEGECTDGLVAFSAMAKPPKRSRDVDQSGDQDRHLRQFENRVEDVVKQLRENHDALAAILGDLKLVRQHTHTLQWVGGVVAFVAFTAAV